MALGNATTGVAGLVGVAVAVPLATAVAVVAVVDTVGERVAGPGNMEAVGVPVIVAVPVLLLPARPGWLELYYQVVVSHHRGEAAALARLARPSPAMEEVLHG